MQIVEMRLPGLKRIKPTIFEDKRGFFFESYRQSNYVAGGIESPFLQDNIASSKRGTVRGLHYQSDPGQAKLISCIQGEIWDVVVDIRQDSPTFGQWEAILLDDVKREQIFIPIGFAHGYCTLSESALVHYKVSAVYDPHTERSIRWNDPQLNIAWPIEHPALSARDEKSLFFSEVFS